jgi:hypothetical protein
VLSALLLAVVAAAEVAYTTLANLADPPLDEPFAAQEWSARATLGASG